MSDIERLETVAAGPLSLTVRWRESAFGPVCSSLELRWAKDRPATARPSTEAQALGLALERYVSGEEADWPRLRWDLNRLSPFTREVLETLRREVAGGPQRPGPWAGPWRPTPGRWCSRATGWWGAGERSRASGLALR